jgi:DNA-binding response OmpR family regulator
MQTLSQETNQLSVLVVDDDIAISKLIRHNLEDDDIRIFEAATGLDCIRILHEAMIDLVLLDISLPDLNGWGILSLIRLTESLRRIPVVMVSVEPPDIALMEKLKPDDYIQKPFNMDDLLVRVRKIISSRIGDQRPGSSVIGNR